MHRDARVHACTRGRAGARPVGGRHEQGCKPRLESGATAWEGQCLLLYSSLCNELASSK